MSLPVCGGGIKYRLLQVNLTVFQMNNLFTSRRKRNAGVDLNDFGKLL